MQACINFLFATVVLFAASNVHAKDIKAVEKDLSDTLITTKITTKYTENTELNPLKIYVTTEKGVVTLSGHVKDKHALVEALRLAKKTNGVKAVNAEDLEVKQVNTGITDAYITAKVEAAVLKAKVLDDESIPLVGINASTDNGVVTLSGDVKSEQSLKPLIKRVSSVHGVKKVISHLKVNPEAS